jgi:hypothetical protein
MGWKGAGLRWLFDRVPVRLACFLVCLLPLPCTSKAKVFWFLCVEVVMPQTTWVWLRRLVLCLWWLYCFLSPF